jgi:Family of unknown function (DUF6533)
MSLQNDQYQDTYKTDLSAGQPFYYPTFQQWPADYSHLLVAALSFLVYDILITFDQEVASIWSCVVGSFALLVLPPSSSPFRKPNRFYTKWLFFFVRYFAVAMQM